MWDLEQALAAPSEQAPFTVAQHNNSIVKLAFSPDGTRLATASGDGTAKIWDAVNGGDALLTLSGHAGWVSSVAFSPDGKRLATASTDGTAKVWDVSPGGSRELLTLVDPKSVGINSVAASPDGARLATGSNDGTVRIWDIETGQVSLTLTGHTDAVLGLDFNRDGTRLATGSLDRTAKVWDAFTGEELLTLAGHGEGKIGDMFEGVMAVAFHPVQDDLLATAGSDGLVKIWDVVAGEELFSLAVHPDGVLNLAFNPEGTRLAASTTSGNAVTSMVKEWIFSKDGVQERRVLSPLPDRPFNVWGLAYSPDGTRLAAADSSGLINVWDAQSDQKLFEITGHSGTIVEIAFSPDGSEMATASADSTVKLWDARDGLEQLTLTGHTSLVASVAYDPDGRWLATASIDGTARVYVLSIEELVSLARSRVTRSLTDQECHQYLHLDACPAEGVE
jgi:WD40 repeat protein